jgi:hypothetical protein
MQYPMFNPHVAINQDEPLMIPKNCGQQGSTACPLTLGNTKGLSKGD